MYNSLIQHYQQPPLHAVSSFPSQQLCVGNQTAVAAFLNVRSDLCNVGHGILIYCMHEHEAEVDTTFSYREHNLQRHVFYTVSHDGKDP